MARGAVVYLQLRPGLRRVCRGLDGAFTLVRCACGMVYLNPMPDNAELARYYPDDYCPHRERKMDPSLKKHRAWKVFILRWYYGLKEAANDS